MCLKEGQCSRLAQGMQDLESFLIKPIIYQCYLEVQRNVVAGLVGSLRIPCKRDPLTEHPSQGQVTGQDINEPQEFRVTTILYHTSLGPYLCSVALN